jgi:hypothetical protein
VDANESTENVVASSKWLSIIYYDLVEDIALRKVKAAKHQQKIFKSLYPQLWEQNITMYLIRLESLGLLKRERLGRETRIIFIKNIHYKKRVIKAATEATERPEIKFDEGEEDE